MVAMLLEYVVTLRCDILYPIAMGLLPDTQS